MIDTGTVKVNVKITEEWNEILVSEMSDAGFHAFEQHSDRVIGYIRQPLWNSRLRNYFLGWLQKKLHDVSVVEEVILPQNWNAIWEAGIEPIEAGDFVILPSWHRTSGAYRDRQEIIIDPKMSFGTGHHETTRLVLGMMSNLDFKDKKVLDAGTGTAVLAIAAIKLGAQQVTAFDIDPWSISNAKENISLNNVDRIELLEGELDTVSESAFDIIVANIIQNVITRFLDGFVHRLVPGGILMVSGILLTGETDLTAVAKTIGLTVSSRAVENEWVSLLFVKQTLENS